MGTVIDSSLLDDGKAVTRQDLDVTNSSKAVIAKIVAGAGISISSTGPDAGTGDVTITATGALPTLTNEKYDLFANNAYTIINDDVADTLISATAKPGSPQYTMTITGGNIPSNEFVADWMAFVCIAGRNTDASTRTINWRFTLNGTDIGSADNSLSPTTTNSYWRACGVFALSAISANDVIGVKMWASVASVVDYRMVSIIIVPRKYKNSTTGIPAFISLSGANGPTGTLSPTISGYSSAGGLNLWGEYIGINSTLQTMVTGVPYLCGANYPIIASYITNNNNLSSGIGTSQQFSAVIIWQYLSVFRYT